MATVKTEPATWCFTFYLVPLFGGDGCVCERERERERERQTDRQTERKKERERGYKHKQSMFVPWYSYL